VLPLSVAPSLTVNARKLGAILNGRRYPTMKLALCGRFRRVTLNRWACGDASPTEAEKLQVAELTLGFLARSGWGR
jgi:hypothetical protein